jgi:hypothetical protein
MNREVHVRFWESPGVKVLRATRPSRPCPKHSCPQRPESGQTRTDVNDRERSSLALPLSSMAPRGPGSIAKP